MISKRQKALLKAKFKPTVDRLFWRHGLFALALIFSTLASVSHIHADDLADSQGIYEDCGAFHHSSLDQAVATPLSIQIDYLPTNELGVYYLQSSSHQQYFQPPARAPPLFS